MDAIALAAYAEQLLPRGIVWTHLYIGCVATGPVTSSRRRSMQPADGTKVAVIGTRAFENTDREVGVSDSVITQM